MLYSLIVGVPPFNGRNANEIKSRILIGTYNSKHEKLLNRSPELQDLISKLLDVNIETRLSAKEALAHSWFIKENGRYLYSIIDKNSIVRILRIYFDILFKLNFSNLFLHLLFTIFPFLMKLK
jgi:serine/threonine protein kinase